MEPRGLCKLLNIIWVIVDKLNYPFTLTRRNSFSRIPKLACDKIWAGSRVDLCQDIDISSFIERHGHSPEYFHHHMSPTAI